MNWTQTRTRAIVHRKKDSYGVWVPNVIRVHKYAVNDTNDAIMIDGRVYRVETDFEFVYKIMKTKIKAIKGAAGLLRHIMEQYDCVDTVEERIINNVKEAKQ